MNKAFWGIALLVVCAGAEAQLRAPTADDLMFKKAPDAPRTRLGVSVQASALMGLGLSVGVPLRGGTSMRGVYNRYSIDHELEDDGGNYDGELRLRSSGLLLDWHPFSGVFRVSGGLMSNGNEVRLTGRPVNGSQFEIGECTYQSDPTDPLQVNGVAGFKSSAPYFGFGWGGNLHAAPGFYGVLDIGVMFSGAADVGLAASGRATRVQGDVAACGQNVDAASSAEVQQQLRNAEADAEEETKDYKLWPNIALGIGWRF